MFVCVPVCLQQTMLNSEEGLDDEERIRRRAERRRAKKKVSETDICHPACGSLAGLAQCYTDVASLCSALS